MWAVLLPPSLGLQIATCRTRKVVIDLTTPHSGSWLFHDQILSDSHKQSSQQADLGWNYAILLLRTHSLCSHGSPQCPDSKTTWWQRLSSSPEVPEGLLGDLVGGCQEAASWGSFRVPPLHSPHFAYWTLFSITSWLHSLFSVPIPISVAPCLCTVVVQPEAILYTSDWNVFYIVVGIKPSASLVLGKHCTWLLSREVAAHIFNPSFIITFHFLLEI